MNVFFAELQIFRALSYIHRSIGVCHRDIKPQNLLVSMQAMLFHFLIKFTELVAIAS